MEFIKKYKNELFLAVVILGVALFSLSTLTTKPRFWTDEGLSIELARNFTSFGRLDLMVEPGIFSGTPFLLQSTGYPMTLPLALFFKIAGVGPWQARVYALAIMLVFLLVVYFFVKNIFGARHAGLSLLLLATFASFYGSGRCVTGEVLGFIFLLVGLYAILYKDKFFLGGLLVGLAIAAKPSVYLMAAPAIMLVFLLDWRGFWQRALRFCAGIAPAAILWVFLSIPDVFLTDAWLKILNFYKNPFGQVSIIDSVVVNLISWPHSTTLIYFSFLFLAVLATIFWDKKFFAANRRLFIFITAYVVLSFAYFLKSPGWLRYLAAAEFLILMILAPVAQSIINKFGQSRIGFFAKNKNRLFYGAILLLALIQGIHLNTKSDLFYSTATTDTVNFLNKEPEGKTIGLSNSIDVGGLILSDKKYQILSTLTGLPALGPDFLAFEPRRLPDLVVAGSEDAILAAHKGVIGEFYNLIYDNGKYNIYAKK